MRKIIISFSFILMSLLTTSLVLAAEPLIQATFSPNPVITNPGNDGYIQLTLKNSGTVAASKIKISRVSLDPDITPSGDWVGDLSSLGAGDSATSLFKFRVSESASLGLHTLTFYIDYGVDSTSRTINPNVIINVQSPSTLELTSIKPSSLRPGERTNMTFTIANKGNSPISNVIFTWTSSGNTILPLGSGNRVVVPMIVANSYYDISMEVSVSPSATPGVYPLSISIQYSDKSGTSQNINSTAGVKIGGETDFDVNLQESAAGTTTLSVANIGINPATSVAIRTPTQEGFSISGATSVFLGDLNPGDYTIASFQLSPRMRNITEGNLIVEISYTDTTGFRQIVQKEVPIRTEMSEMQQSPYPRQSVFGILQLVGIAVIGIIAIVVFYKFWKRKKR